MGFSFVGEIKKYPFVRLLLPFMTGIILALNFTVNFPVLYSLLIIFIVAFFVFGRVSEFRTQILLGLFINIILIFSGYLLTQNKLAGSKNEALLDHGGYMVGKIISDPVVSDRTVRINVDIEAIKQNELWHKTSGRTMLYLSHDERTNEIKPGKYIIFSPQLSEIANRGNPEEFDYKRYLSYNLIHTSDFLNTDDWDFLGEKEDKNLRFKILNFRQQLIGKLEAGGMQEDELGVISALALGYRNRLSDEIRHNYASSGAMHILAVSGLHVGIVYMVIVFLFSFIKNKKLLILKVALTIILIWFYAFLTGLSPSVSRAATMFSFIAASAIFKRSPGVFNSIAASAFLLLMINPLMLTQIGFQLSYMAVTGIVLVFPKIYGLVVFKNFLLDKIWSLTVVSIAAQIATAPIAVYYFNQFSNYFLLTNYLLIPLATVAIYLTLSVFVFGKIEIISDFLINILSKVLEIMNYFTSMIESLPGSVSSNLHINLAQMLLIYLLIIFFGVFFFATKKYKQLVHALIVLLALSSVSLYKNINRIDQKYIIVYNINRTSAVNLIDGKDNILFANFDDQNINRIEFSAKNNWLKLGLENEKFIDISRMTSSSILSNIAVIDNKKVFQKNNFIAFEDIRILLCNRNFDLSKYASGENNNKLSIDYLILSDNANIRLSEIAELFEFNKIIFDSSNSDWRIARWENENEEQGFKIHNVKTHGAFIKTL